MVLAVWVRRKQFFSERYFVALSIAAVRFCVPMPSAVTAGDSPGYEGE